MKKFLGILFFLCYAGAQEWAHLSSIDLSREQQELLNPKKSVIFEKKLSIPATQILFSWNAVRPQEGYFDFYMQVRNATTKKWSDWALIASWGNEHQQSYGKKNINGPSFHYVRWEAEDAPLDMCKIKIIAQNGASLNNVYRLGIAAINYSAFISEQNNAYQFSFPSKHIRSVPTFSQMQVNHPERGRICSPTSLAMVVSYLNRQKEDILPFLDGVYDRGLDTYGSWPFNIAHAFNQCHTRFYFSVTRLNSFEELYRYIVRNLPVIVSIRGPLKTMPAGKLYAEGHLLVIVGWDNAKKQVLCHDPAFESSNEVFHAYDIKDFLRVWEKSKRLAYVVEPRLS